MDKFSYYSRDDLRAKLPVSLATVDRLEKAGSFPASIQMSPKVRVWVSAEVDQWVADRLASRRHGNPVIQQAAA